MSEYVNPKLFRKLSEPITDEQADKNLEKFHEELKRLREECHIPNLALICSVNIEDKESETGEKTVASTAMMGERANWSMLVAHLYGGIQEDLANVLARATQAGKKSRR